MGASRARKSWGFQSKMTKSFCFNISAGLLNLGYYVEELKPSVGKNTYSCLAARSSRCVHHCEMSPDSMLH